jgi:glycosyltransferase involved in cell wall biosynthesis
MKIWLVDLEAVETRYTKQWKTEFPKLLKHRGHTVEVVSGGSTPQATTPGAFLNFGGTNVYKSKQLEKIAELFCKGEVTDGDYFLYTDAWNPTVIQLKYMAELLGIDVRIGGLWHAGSYDPADFLGRLIGNKPWVRNAERSMYECFDHNFFASDFHIDMFMRDLLEIDKEMLSIKKQQLIDSNKIVRTGWPFEYMDSLLTMYKGMTKTNTVLFPHRLAPEKQLQIFEDLKQSLPQYKFVVCQEKPLTKNEYHNLLGEAKLVFSANLQETLGISWYEGALVGALPMVPDRLSYTEMALDQFKYPSEWTESMESYSKHKKQVISKIVDYMENYGDYLVSLNKQVQKLNGDYFGCKNLLEVLK